MQNKKAQGLTLNTVVIAILVLLVLVILSLIFLKGVKPISEGIAACENKGGACIARNQCNPDTDRIITGVSCSGADGKAGTPDDVNEVCCVKL